MGDNDPPPEILPPGWENDPACASLWFYQAMPGAVVILARIGDVLVPVTDILKVIRTQANTWIVAGQINGKPGAIRLSERRGLNALTEVIRNSTKMWEREKKNRQRRKDPDNRQSGRPLDPVVQARRAQVIELTNKDTSDHVIADMTGLPDSAHVRVDRSRFRNRRRVPKA